MGGDLHPHISAGHQTFNFSLKSARPEPPDTTAGRSGGGADCGRAAFADFRNFDVAAQDLLDVMPDRDPTGPSTLSPRREEQGKLG